MTEDQDKELEQYLEGDSKPSRAYAELGDETPPPELDARILAAAEREVKVTGIDAQRSPPFKAFAWAAIVVLSFSLVLNIVFDEAVREPVGEFNGILEQAQTPAVLDEVRKQEQMPAASAEAKVRRDQPVEFSTNGDFDEGDLDASNDEVRARKELALSARKRESSVERQVLRRMEVMPEERRLTVAAPPAAARQLSQDAFLREQIVAVLEDYSAQLSTLALSSEAAARVDDGTKELDAESKVVGDPEAELANIIDAFNANRDDEAFAKLVEFREAWPGHPVTLALAERGL
jgi:hypothetical protein